MNLFYISISSLSLKTLKILQDPNSIAPNNASGLPVEISLTNYLPRYFEENIQKFDLCACE